MYAYIYVYIYVCMYVCRNRFEYAMSSYSLYSDCMHVCMHISEGMFVCVYAFMYKSLSVFMHVYVCMYVCMYIRIYTPMHSLLLINYAPIIFRGCCWGRHVTFDEPENISFRKPGMGVDKERTT